VPSLAEKIVVATQKYNLIVQEERHVLHAGKYLPIECYSEKYKFHLVTSHYVKTPSVQVNFSPSKSQFMGEGEFTIFLRKQERFFGENQKEGRLLFSFSMNFTKEKFERARSQIGIF